MVWKTILYNQNILMIQFRVVVFVLKVLLLLTQDWIDTTERGRIWICISIAGPTWMQATPIQWETKEWLEIHLTMCKTYYVAASIKAIIRKLKQEQTAEDISEHLVIDILMIETNKINLSIALGAKLLLMIRTNDEIVKWAKPSQLHLMIISKMLIK